MGKNIYKAIVVDDHKVVREGLKMLLSNLPNLQVLAEASNGEEALKEMEKQNLDFMTLDLSMPIMSGIELIKCLKKKGLEVKILVMSMHSDSQYIKQCRELGVPGYIFKDAEDDEIINAVNKVLSGEYYYSDAVNRMAGVYGGLQSHKKNMAQEIGLTEIEVMVLGQLILEKEEIMVSNMALTVSQVEEMKNTIMNKMEVTNEIALVREAIRRKIVE